MSMTFRRSTPSPRPAAANDDRTRRRSRGQGLVEFAVAVIPFLMLLMAVVDLGRGIYMMNGTSEAARDIARVVSVHQWPANGNDLGSSSQAAEVIAAQRRMIPGLALNPSTDIQCVDALDQVLVDTECTSGKANYIRVHLTATFTPVTPLVSAFGTHTFDSTSRMKVP